MLPEVPNANFNLSSKGTKTFGFQVDNGDTFDVVYTVMFIRTALEGETAMPPPSLPNPFDTTSSRKLLINSVGCIYVVSAAGAAQPDIRANVYNGAICQWQTVPGVGENFLVDYALPF